MAKKTKSKKPAVAKAAMMNGGKHMMPDGVMMSDKDMMGKKKMPKKTH